MPTEFNPDLKLCEDKIKIPEERIDELTDKVLKAWLEPIKKIPEASSVKIDPYDLRVISEIGIRVCIDDDHKVYLILQNDNGEPKKYTIENIDDAKDIAGQFVADVLDEKLPKYTA